MKNPHDMSLIEKVDWTNRWKIYCCSIFSFVIFPDLWKNERGDLEQYVFISRNYRFIVLLPGFDSFKLYLIKQKNPQNKLLIFVLYV